MVLLDTQSQMVTTGKRMTIHHLTFVSWWEKVKLAQNTAQLHHTVTAAPVSSLAQIPRAINVSQKE